MARNVNDIINSLPLERQAKIAERTKELIAEHLACKKEKIHSKFAAVHKIVAAEKETGVRPGLTWCRDCKEYHLTN